MYGKRRSRWIHGCTLSLGAGREEKVATDLTFQKTPTWYMCSGTRLVTLGDALGKTCQAAIFVR
jgi:hypothetical protein